MSGNAADVLADVNEPRIGPDRLFQQTAAFVSAALRQNLIPSLPIFRSGFWALCAQHSPPSHWYAHTRVGHDQQAPRCERTLTHCGCTHASNQEVLMCIMWSLPIVLQVLSPFCEPARGASTYTQSQDVEAELQQLIQSRLKDGQAPLPELTPKSTVSPCAFLTFHAASAASIQAAHCQLSPLCMGAAHPQILNSQACHGWNGALCQTEVSATRAYHIRCKQTLRHSGHVLTFGSQAALFCICRSS